ncbi:hypothetical protein [Planctomycetes bacterium Pan216]|uniref:hypothetical protein n=1 Tax=Kolteria novifilia TaxID=2527975 RepID=UPI0011A5198C
MVASLIVTPSLALAGKTGRDRQQGAGKTDIEREDRLFGFVSRMMGKGDADEKEVDDPGAEPSISDESEEKLAQESIDEVAGEAVEIEQEPVFDAEDVPGAERAFNSHRRRHGASVRENDNRVAKGVGRYLGWIPGRSSKSKSNVQTIERDSGGKYWFFGGDDDDNPRAEYAEAEQLFRDKKFSSAAGKFKAIAKKYKDTPIEEDALFMRAESEYARKRLPKAQDTYVALLTKFPTTRHLPLAVQRLSDISYTWLEDSRLVAQGKKPARNKFSRTVNFFDRSRPFLDTEGRALEAIEAVQQYDPFGPQTDDAVMWAANHSFVNEDYFIAATYYEQVLTDQPKSEHAVRAAALGAKSYMLNYAGPDYDGADLKDAHRLTKAALTRSLELTAEQRDRLERDLRAIELELAKREFVTAQQYERMGKPVSALYYYHLVNDKYRTTDWGERARTEIARIEGEASQPGPSMMGRLASILPGGSSKEEVAEARRADQEPGSIAEAAAEEVLENAADEKKAEPAKPSRGLSVPNLFDGF